MRHIVAVAVGNLQRKGKTAIRCFLYLGDVHVGSLWLPLCFVNTPICLKRTNQPTEGGPSLAPELPGDVAGPPCGGAPGSALNTRSGCFLASAAQWQ